MTGERSAQAHPRGAAENRRSPHRRPAGRQGHLRPRTQPRLPAHLPAGVRLRLARRRRFHHLQHLLDHRRPAHPRVRAAANARRLAAPDPAVGCLRRPDARGGGRCARAARRPRARPGAQRAVQGFWRRTAAQRHGRGVPHDRRLADGRHRGDAARRAAGGAARHARAAARGDARGSRDPAGGADPPRDPDPCRRRYRSPDPVAARARRWRRPHGPRDRPRRAHLHRRSPSETRLPAEALPGRAGARARHRRARPLAWGHGTAGARRTSSASRAAR